MMHLSLALTVREFVTSHFLYGRQDESLGDTDSLLDAGLIDSTGVLELVTFLESTLGIRVADDEVMPENLDSIARIAAYVARKWASEAQKGGVSHAS